MNIIELAKEAGIPCFAGMYVVTEPAELERFAALVAAHERNKYLDKLAEAIDLSVKAEREACAKVCDETRYTIARQKMGQHLNITMPPQRVAPQPSEQE